MAPEQRAVPDMPGERVSEEVEHYLKTKVSQILRTRYQQFPGSQPVSFTRDHLHHNLMERDYLVCEKSDGLRVLMLVLVNPDTSEEGTFLINRENEYYFVPGFHFPRTAENFDSSHNGTILDGELVFSTHPQTGIREIRYLIFDCMAMDMQSVMHKNLYKRLYHAQHEFHKPYMELRRAYPDACSHFPFKLDFKNMTQPYKIDKIFKEMKNLTYVSDGLVLTCCDSPYTVGTDPSLLKWKPAEENTIDFKVALTFPTYTDESLPKHEPGREYPDYDSKPHFKLCVWKGGVNPYEGESVEENIARNGGEYKNGFDNYDDWNDLLVTDAEWGTLKESGESFNGRIAECRRTASGDWQMLRWRDDKLNGNHINVVLKILKSIEDSVTKEELISAEGEIKQRWIERDQEKKRRWEQEQRRHSNHISHSTASAVSAAPPKPTATKMVHPRQGEDEYNGEEDEYVESDGMDEMPKYSKTNDNDDVKRRRVN